MKKYWKWIVLVLVIIVAIVGVILYRRDSHGKPFKANLANEKVMMKPDWYAKVRLTANDGATYEVKNSKGKVIQSKTSTKGGKADIKLNNTGNYTIVAKSDNGHVSKKLPLKVTNYKANINKWTNAVGPLKFKIGKVEYKEATKGGETTINNTDAYNQLNKHFYRIIIHYTAYNSSSKPIDSLTTVWSPIIDGNQEISVDNGDGEGYADSSIREGGNPIPAHGKTQGTFVINYNRKITAKNLKIHVTQISSTDLKTLDSKGGTAKLK